MPMNRDFYPVVQSEFSRSETFAKEFHEVAKRKLLARWDRAVTDFRDGLHSHDSAVWMACTGLRCPFDVARGG